MSSKGRLTGKKYNSNTKINMLNLWTYGEIAIGLLSGLFWVFYVSVRNGENFALTSLLHLSM